MYEKGGGRRPGVWWRGSYKIVDGLIRLASSPSVYRPDDVTEIGDATMRPYASLLRLAHRASYDRDHNPSLRTAEEIVTWCNRHGLLGLALQHTVLVRTWPRWMPRIDPQGERGLLIPGRAGHASARLVPIAQQFVRDDSAWLALYEILSPKQRSAAAPTKPRAAAPEELVDWREPGVAVATHDGDHDWQPVASAWGRFFPDVPEKERERYGYPRPLSLEFWQLYAEPVAAFLAAATGLRDHVAALRSERHAPRKRGELVAKESARIKPARKPGIAHSLLGMLSEMITADLEAGYRVEACAECGGPFLSETRRVRYCSPTCRNTSVVRAYRHRLKQTRGRPPAHR